MKHKCDNCGVVYTDKTLPYDLFNTHDLGIRLDPGSVVPSGECKCGAFTYLAKRPKKTRNYGNKCLIQNNNNHLPCRKRNNGFFCTLVKGHKGDHVACGCETHNLHVWKGKP